MKKLIVSVVFVALCGMSLSQLSCIGYAKEDVDVVGQSIQTRELKKYRFNKVPPNKFNGMLLVYYEYIKSGDYYIGWYN